MLEYNEDVIRDFIWRLPDITVQPPTVHLLMLAARSKKAKELLGFKIRDLVIEREIVRATTEIWRKRYFSKLYNLIVLQQNGLYDIKSETVNLEAKIPPEVMGIYSTISPRNVYLSMSDLMKENIDYLYVRDEHSDQELAKLSSRFFGFLHKHKAKGYNYLTVDVDTLDKKVFNEAKDIVSPFKKFMITETSGGYHIVLNLCASSDAADFYKMSQGNLNIIQKLAVCAKTNNAIIEIQRDAQEPVPGTLYCRKGGEHYLVKLLE